MSISIKPLEDRVVIQTVEAELRFVDRLQHGEHGLRTHFCARLHMES